MIAAKGMGLRSVAIPAAVRVESTVAAKEDRQGGDLTHSLAACRSMSGMAVFVRLSDACPGRARGPCPRLGVHLSILPKLSIDAARYCSLDARDAKYTMFLGEMI
jgi:hypothetical protein